jgi:hypothetical protein
MPRVDPGLNPYHPTQRIIVPNSIRERLYGIMAWQTRFYMTKKRPVSVCHMPYAVYVNKVKSPDLVLGIVTIWNMDKKTMT